MEVQTKASELVKYTSDNALKEQIVPKRDRWALGNRLIDTALELSVKIDEANTFRLDDADEARQRHLAQRAALAATFKLSTLIQTIRDIVKFDERIHKYWIKLVKEEQKLLLGWIDSDRRRSV